MKSCEDFQAALAAGDPAGDAHARGCATCGPLLRARERAVAALGDRPLPPDGLVPRAIAGARRKMIAHRRRAWLGGAGILAAGAAAASLVFVLLDRARPASAPVEEAPPTAGAVGRDLQDHMDIVVPDPPGESEAELALEYTATDAAFVEHVDWDGAIEPVALYSYLGGVE
jgi:hypothetical protein